MFLSNFEPRERSAYYYSTRVLCIDTSGGCGCTIRVWMFPFLEQVLGLLEERLFMIRKTFALESANFITLRTLCCRGSLTSLLASKSDRM